MEVKGKELIGPILGVIGSILLIADTFVVPVTPSSNSYVLFIGFGILGLIGATLSFTGKRAVGGGLMIGVGILGLMVVGGLVLLERFYPPYDTDPLLLVALFNPLLILCGGILVPRKIKG